MKSIMSKMSLAKVKQSTHHHDFYEIHATLKGEAGLLFERTAILTIKAGKCAAHPFQRFASYRPPVFRCIRACFISLLPLLFWEVVSTPWSNLSACFPTNGREKESCIASRTGSIEAKLSFIDHPPDKKITVKT